MTPSSAALEAAGSLRQARGVAGWLALAASPSFAGMACLTAGDGHPMDFCSSEPSILPIDGMTMMYLLMGLFHLPPWLKIASSRPWLLINLNKGDR